MSGDAASATSSGDGTTNGGARGATAGDATDGGARGVKAGDATGGVARGAKAGDATGGAHGATAGDVTGGDNRGATVGDARVAAAELRAAVERAEAAFALVDESVTRRAPAPGKWCAAEVLGHLIDSVANNHQRFVRARWQSDLVFAGYEQDGWVDAQMYASAPWRELVVLWAAYNRHLARVFDALPAPLATRVHTRHVFDRIAWRPVRAGEPVTLAWFAEDYVGHLRHHLAQIDALLGTNTHRGP